MLNMKWNCFVLTTSPAIKEDLLWNMKSTRRRYCTMKCSPEQVIQQRKNKMKYLWGLLFTSEEAAQLPRSVFLLFFWCYVWKNHCLDHKLKYSPLQIKATQSLALCPFRLDNNRHNSVPFLWHSNPLFLEITQKYFALTEVLCARKKRKKERILEQSM